MKLQTRIPLISLPLVGLPLLIVGMVAYLHLEKGAETQASRNIQMLLKQLAGQSDSQIHTAEANASLFANYPLLRYFMTSDDEEERYALIQRPLYSKLRAIQRAYPEYYEIRILRPDGEEELRVVNQPLVNLRDNEANTRLFQQIQNAKQRNLSLFDIDENSAKPAFFVSQQLRFNSNALDISAATPPLRGYLVLSISLENLQQLLNNNPLGDRGGVVVVDSQGTPLLTPSHLQLSGALPSPLSDGRYGHAEFRPFLLNGEEYLSLSYPLQGQVYLTALVPRRELLTQSQDIGQLVAVIALISLLITLPLMFWLIRLNFLDPMQKLLHGVRSIASGELGIQVNLSRSDEFGELSQAFNRMSAQLRRFHERIQSIAFNDPLTGLPNRALFARKLQRLMYDTQEQNQRMALLFLDLDNFKHINDSQGHQTGDTLLRIVARRLEENLRGDDFIARDNDTRQETAQDSFSHTLARLGGDEFTILIPGIRSGTQVTKIAQRILTTVAEPVIINELEFYVGASIGITLYPGDGETPEELIKNADLAMYQAKRLGKNNYQFYSETISQESISRINLEQRLHKAVDNGDFELYYQPIVSAEQHQIISFEALVRWHDEDFGMVTPDRFIPLAEESGMVIKLGSWVLEEACRQLSEWRRRGLTQIRVAVNVSGVQLNKSDVCSEISRLRARYQLPPECLYVELTESAILEGHAKAIEVINRLRAQGTLIALDDFGTGYSSLSYLRNLPIDLLKIDRSFICEISPHNHPVILSSIIEMAHALNLKVIAEGVETQEQLDYLQQRDCDLIQGFLFSKARPAEEIPALIEAFQPLQVAANQQ